MKIYSRCVMDNQADQMIRFDDDGVCNYCTKALQRKELVYFPNEKGRSKLKSLVAQLKNEGINHEYDCLVGISGGLDSAYLLYLAAVKWGLRVLAVHVDDGFNTEISERNIKRLGALPQVTLKIIKVDQQQYNSLVKAFLLAGVPNLAMVQDNTLFTILYQEAGKHKIKSFLSGANFALESILQEGNTTDAFDLKNTKAINKRFGAESINRLQLMSLVKRDLYYVGFGIRIYKSLDWIDCNQGIGRTQKWMWI
jgi:hypothetical protein